ncbi:hypothetical protein HBA54_21885 [Pelagibius litoralis]|uniref:Uncharacterized protein n=1 Tax=Pelagibius litoralis TaxID=374515 RepID=A0A967F1B7_9PROT|nr:DUF6634 family protein [Pelagibius litoralis]NIA71255.1 hypothetical protein [Pelagibius litoralis]
MPHDPKILERLRDATAALTRLERGEEPSPEELKAAPKLDWWYLTEHHGALALGGVVTGHPTLPEGAHIYTSCLLWVAEDQRAARTLSRFYRLGTPLDDVLATKN